MSEKRSPSRRGRSDPHPSSNRPQSLPVPVARAIDELARNHRSGSVPLALRACAVLEHCKHPPSEAAGVFYRRLAQAVAEAQPSMAAVWNVCDRWLRQVQRGSTPLTSARSVARELSGAQRAASAQAAALVQKNQVVMSYSASSTVEAALLIALRKMARRKRRHFRVLCAEGRPKYEGRAMAQRLAGHGVSVELFTDSALLASLARADLVLIGCDAILPDGFVNKVGTHALLRMSRIAHIPAYVVADSFKFLPAVAITAFSVREENSSEVWKGVGKKLRVRNFYFEKVPLGACSGLIMEQGLYTGKEVASLLRAGKLGATLGDAPRRNRLRRKD